MKMDEDDRKKLEKFWRRKLWLGLAAVGALGLAAWRVSAVQSRYDDVLIQESRELPEKVYQELVAEVRKGVPILPNHTPGTDLSKYSEKALRCDSILALGFLGDARAIPELGKILNDDLNRAISCKHYSVYHRNAQENSAYTSAVSALSQFKEAEAIGYLKASVSKPPSPKLLSIWRHFYSKEFFISYENRTMFSNEQLIQYDAQPVPDAVNSRAIGIKNKSVIESLLKPPLSQTNLDKIRSRVQENSNPGMKQKESDIEELFKEYVRHIFSTQNYLFEQKLKTLEEAPKVFLERFQGEFKYDSRRFISTLSTAQDPAVIPMNVTSELLKSSQIKAEILAVFENNKSSDKVLSTLRSNLAKLNQSFPMRSELFSDILFEILLIDINKSRLINQESANQSRRFYKSQG